MIACPSNPTPLSDLATLDSLSPASDRGVEKVSDSCWRRPSITNGWMVVLIATVIGGCTARPPRPEAIALPAVEITVPGMTFLPLNEPEWLRLKSSSGGFSLAKAGAGRDETFAIEARAFPVDNPDASTTFAAQVKALNNARALPPRYVQRHHESALRRTGSLDCVRSYLDIEDRQALKRSSPVVGTMTLAVADHTCIVPGNPTRVVSLSYSHRHDPADADPQFRKKADAILDRARYEAPR